MSSTHIPFLDLVSPHLEMEEELVTVFRTALHTAAFIGGKAVQDFENAFAEFCEVEPLCRCGQRDRCAAFRTYGRRGQPWG